MQWSLFLKFLLVRILFDAVIILDTKLFITPTVTYKYGFLVSPEPAAIMLPFNKKYIEIVTQTVFIIVKKII